MVNFYIKFFFNKKILACDKEQIFNLNIEFSSYVLCDVSIESKTSNFVPLNVFFSKIVFEKNIGNFFFWLIYTLMKMHLLHLK